MELDLLRQERTKIVTEGRLQSENIDCFYSPDRISFNNKERSYIDKEWIGTKGIKFNRLFGQKRIIKPLSVGSMIVTSDNKWIIGRRLKTYDFEGQYTLLAGYMDPDDDIVNFKPDPFFAIKREIEEETGINKNHDISNIVCLGLDYTDQPYLAFSTLLRISYNELISNIPEEKEFRKFEGYQYERYSLENFIISKYRELTPHTLANMLMSHKVLGY